MAHGRSPRHVRKAKPAGDARPETARAGEGAPGNSSAARSARAAARSGASASSRKPAPEKLARTLESAGEPVRLQRLLASAGFGSRREVESLIADGRVSVNGDVAGLGDRATPGRDDIRLDGERVLSDRPVYWLVNKPRGVVTTVRDESGRRTVLDLIPRKVGRVFPVGRLDVETSGLLLLTNDGETAYAMLHPSLGNEREYRVSVKGAIDEKAIGRLEKGVRLEEGKTAPGRVRDVQIDPKTGTSTFSLTLVEGRNRQIRRSLLILGFPVRRLVRERMGPLRLEGLAVGESRPLSPEERTRLLAHVASLRRGEGGERREDRPARGASKLGMRGLSARPRSSAGKAPRPTGSTRAGASAKPSRPSRPTGPTRSTSPAAPKGARRPPSQRARSRKGDRK